MSLNDNWLVNALRTRPRTPGGVGQGPRPPDQPRGLPSRSSLRKTFIACLITSGFMTYIYVGNLQLLIISRYYADVGIADLWAGDEARYYLHMTAINGVILGVIIFLWVWRRMTGKRLLVMVLFFNFAALGAGYTSLHGRSFAAANEKMREAAEELAAATRGFPTPNLDRYPRSPGELKRAYRAPLSPYSYRGQRQALRIEVIYNAAGPFKDSRRRGDTAGTIYYAVNREGKKFWITYLQYDFVGKESVLAIDEEKGELIVLTETG